MNKTFKSSAGVLTIGDLADRTGVAPATLRMWEQRHGFPVPERLPSGHRRYRESDVSVVSEVVRRREDGVRLDVAIERAIAEVRAAAVPGPTSLFAELRRTHPAVHPYRLRKDTLLALSWAIEDEFCAKATRPHLFGGFQRAEFWRPSRYRWRALSRVARSTYVFLDQPGVVGSTGPVEVVLEAGTPMRGEWFVVCDSPELPAVLSAWELPGQDDVPDHARLFESVWSVEPAVVREAARCCASAAAAAGAPGAAEVLEELVGPAPGGRTDLATVTTLFNRVVAYVDDATHKVRA